MPERLLVSDPREMGYAQLARLVSTNFLAFRERNFLGLRMVYFRYAIQRAANNLYFLEKAIEENNAFSVFLERSGREITICRSIDLFRPQVSRLVVNGSGIIIRRRLSFSLKASEDEFRRLDAIGEAGLVKSFGRMTWDAMLTRLDKGVAIPKGAV